MWVVIALLVVAVIAVVIATSLDRGTAINYTQFREYTNNYVYSVKNDDGPIVTDGHVQVYVLDDEGNRT